MFKSRLYNEKNFDRTSLDIAIDMIYVFNGCRLIKEKITLGTPIPLDQRPELPDDPNTFIPLRVKEEIDYRFDIKIQNNGIMYRRLHLSEIKDINEIEVAIEDFPFKVSDVLDQINGLLKVKLTLDDVEDTVFESLEQGFTLTIKPTSLAWIGSLQLKDVVTRTKENLFTELLLSDFKPYQGPTTEVVKPYEGADFNRLSDKLNELNSTNHQYFDDYTFGTPILDNSIPGYNTQVDIHPQDKFKYNTQTLKYNRLSLSILNNLPEGWITPVRLTKIPFTIHEMLSVINFHLGLTLQASEVENTTYTSEQSEYTLRISSSTSSLAWTKSSYSFKAYVVGSGERYTEDGVLRLTENNVIRFID